MPGAKRLPPKTSLKTLEAVATAPAPAAAQPVQSPAADAPQAASTPAMSQQWSCTIANELTKLTVGEEFYLDCEGPPTTLTKKNLTIEVQETQKYSLHLLEARELTETKARLVVTPWRAGEWKVINPALTDQNVRVGLGDVEFKVATVIDAKANPEGKPFPPLLPLTLAWPLWLWLFAAAMGCGVLYLFGLALRKSLSRKRLLKLLEKNATALSPVNHFNKELRGLQRLIPVSGQTWTVDGSEAFFRELDSQFRWFLARELVIQALDGSAGSILKELKKADPEVYKHSSRDLRVALLELRKAQGVRASSEDAHQLLDLARKVAVQIAKERNV